MESDKTEKVFDNQVLIKTPVVRNGKKASIGFQPEIWKSWE
jgi:arsenate reductase-like glutaredoxin family protein